MKKISKGKVYDTETAKKLGSDSHSNSSDFHHWYEALYQKRTGEFFLYGEGGPMTKYAQSAGQNSWTGGDLIIPLTAAKAREWAEEHLDADEYAEIFGMPDEGSDERTTLCVQIPVALAAKLRERASDDGASLTATVAQALEKFLS